MTEDRFLEKLYSIFTRLVVDYNMPNCTGYSDYSIKAYNFLSGELETLSKVSEILVNDRILFIDGNCFLDANLEEREAMLIFNPSIQYTNFKGKYCTVRITRNNPAVIQYVAKLDQYLEINYQKIF